MAVHVITSAPSDELLSLDDAKRHLRVYDGSLDDEVASLIRAARDYCERFCNRTLRATTTRTFSDCEWWANELRLPFPPLLAVSSITYYDVANVSQTLATSNYYVATPTDDGGFVRWKDGATIPSHYTRDDAITVTYTTGYAALTSIPPVVVQAMKCKLSELFAAESESEVRAAREACDRMLYMADWTGYR